MPARSGALEFDVTRKILMVGRGIAGQSVDLRTVLLTRQIYEPVPVFCCEPPVNLHKLLAPHLHESRLVIDSIMEVHEGTNLASQDDPFMICSSERYLEAHRAMIDRPKDLRDRVFGPKIDLSGFLHAIDQIDKLNSASKILERPSFDFGEPAMIRSLNPLPSDFTTFNWGCRGGSRTEAMNAWAQKRAKRKAQKRARKAQRNKP